MWVDSNTTCLQCAGQGNLVLVSTLTIAASGLATVGRRATKSPSILVVSESS